MLFQEYLTNLFQPEELFLQPQRFIVIRMFPHWRERVINREVLALKAAKPVACGCPECKPQTPS